MPTQPYGGSALDDLQALTKEDVADRLQISVRSVERLIEQGDLQTMRPSKHGVPVRIPAGSLAATSPNPQKGPKDVTAQARAVPCHLNWAQA